MNNQVVSIALCSLLLTACSEREEPLRPPEPGGLFVTVTNEAGQPVADANVSTMPGTGSFTTDSLGTVLFAKLTPGFYAVKVSHALLGLAQQPVQVDSGQLTEVTLILTGMQTVPGAPTVEIIAPSSGSAFQPGETITFRGMVSDDVDSPMYLALTWQSSIDGVFSSAQAGPEGRTEVVTDTLSSGAHVITLRASDSSGIFNTASISIAVGDVGDLPEPVTLAPLTQDSTSVHLSWSASTESEPFSYRVHRALGADGSFEVVAIINDTSIRTYQDSDVQSGQTYRYRVGVLVGLEALSNVESIIFGTSIDVGFPVEIMLVDAVRPYLYALDRVNNSLHFINLDEGALEKTIFVGSTPTDMDINLTGTELYIANFGGTEVAIVDLATREVARSIFVDISQGTWAGNPYRLAAMDGDTFAFSSEDQWCDLKLASATNGAHLSAVGSIYEPDLVRNPAGTSVYIGESGISRSTVIRFDVSQGVLMQADISEDAGGFSDRWVTMSRDGVYLFYAGKKYLASNLGSTLGTFSENIFVANQDGSIAVGSEHIFDGTTFSILRPLPLVTTKMAISADDSTLYLYDDASSRIFIYDLTAQ